MDTIQVKDKQLIGGETVGTLIDSVLSSKIGYEKNLFKVITGTYPEEEKCRVAKALLIGLSLYHEDDLDINLLKLCASTGASFEESIRPSFCHYEEIARSGELICNIVQNKNSIDKINKLIKKKIKDKSLDGFYDIQDSRLDETYWYIRDLYFKNMFETQSAKAILEIEKVLSSERVYKADIEMLSAAFLVEMGIPFCQFSFFKIIGRLPVLAFEYQKEVNNKPNQYKGLVEVFDSSPNKNEWLKTKAVKSLKNSESFVQYTLSLITRKKLKKSELKISEAAFVIGAEYGIKSASSNLVRLMASRSAAFAQTFEAVISTYGRYHLGAIKEGAKFIKFMTNQTSNLYEGIEKWVDLSVNNCKSHKSNSKISGFGHRFELRDKRAFLLMKLCKKHLPGKYTNIVNDLDDIMYEKRFGHVNLDGIGGAMCLQVGIPVEVLSVVSMISRIPGVVKYHANEFGTNKCYSLKTSSGLV